MQQPTKGRIVIHRSRGAKDYEDGDWPAMVVDVAERAVTLFVFTPWGSYVVVTNREPSTDDQAGWHWPPREGA